jgi:hypothetical protein
MGVEQQESPAARPKQLAADLTVLAGGLVPVVDLRATDPSGELALHHPALVHDVAEIIQARVIGAEHFTRAARKPRHR